MAKLVKRGKRSKERRLRVNLVCYAITCVRAFPIPYMDSNIYDITIRELVDPLCRDGTDDKGTLPSSLEVFVIAILLWFLRSDAEDS